VADTRRFFLVAFGVTWALQVPGVLARWGILPGDPDAYLPFAMLGIFGPAVAALWESQREGGREAVRALLGRFSLRGVGPLDPFLALLVPGLLLSFGLVLLRVAGREGPVSYLPDAPHLIAGVVISVAEELGWRGYALPRLEARYGAFGGNGVLGVLWALWHIPMLLAVGIGLQWMPAMLLFFVGGSLYFGFLVRRTGGSLVIAVLAHLGAHLNNSHAAMPGDAVPFLVHTVVYAALGLFTMRGALALRGPRSA
jgi:membrane protease YdiL (CAAX protease family)